MRFKQTVGGVEAAKLELAKVEASPLSSSDSLYLSASAFIAFRELEPARKKLDILLQNEPNNTDAHLLYAELHSREGNINASLNSLRAAEKTAPGNREIKEKLAIQLAFTLGIDGQENWAERQAEIDRLLSEGDAKDTPNRQLIRAAIDLEKGDLERQKAAEKVLEQIANLPTRISGKAKQLLAKYETTLWEKEDVRVGQSVHFAKAKSLYEDLLRKPTPNPMDAVFLTALHLVAADKEKAVGDESLAMQRLRDAEASLRRLERLARQSQMYLQLLIRVSVAIDPEADVEAIASKWIEGIDNIEESRESRFWEIAGSTLLRFGFGNESLLWWKQLYAKDKSKYRGLVIAYVKAKQIPEAIGVCLEEYAREPSIDKAVLLCEVAILDRSNELSLKVDNLLLAALDQFKDVAALFEAVGTLRQMQGKDSEAIAAFERCLELEPKSIRALNNLALILCRLPSRTEEALEHMNKAIEIRSEFSKGDKDPELLDSLATVQMHSGNLADAQKTVESAIALRKDPRFQIHLAQIFMAQKNDQGLKTLWTEMDLAKLDANQLSLDEKQTLQRLRQLVSASE